MKKIIFLFLLFTKVTFAQETKNKIVYLDSLFYETNPNKTQVDSTSIKITQEKYKYYRIIKDYYLNKDEYLFTQYYSSDKIESEGISTNKDYFMKKGEVVSYYENGHLKSKINYIDNHQSGKCFFWYENGNKKLEGEFIISKENQKLDSKLKIINFWDLDNNQKVKDGFGEYIDKESFITITTSNGKIENGFKEGIWKGSSEKYNFLFEENYEKGNLIGGTSIDENNIKYNYNIIEALPEIKGGMTVFYSFLRNNFKMPDIPGLNGKVMTSFIINENGDISDLKIIRSLNPIVDKEAIRVLSKFKGFSPALVRGIKVKSNYVIPISVQIPND